ncbi:glycoside hydrolase family 19 protein [Zymobacter palmae]|uniref:Glycoside hydrolase, family 19 n=1 Tax=Zymobacter palmae TaxID=33074 RepID=A0A348HIL9_9GAMM|nr:glycoside hydrolase family 19 protein [Zymobacter palmae]BBG31471.1 glycoside hydrolase, family 19 [Zymobacter palmae]
MAQEVTGEMLKQAFNDFQAYRRAGKIVVDYSLLSSIVMHFTAKNSPKKHEMQEYYLQNLVAPLNRWMPVYGIDTAIRAAHFLSQACCETFQFTAVTEIPKNGGKEYDGRKSLGNTQPGDGPRYIGRGLLHLTGRENYRVMGNKIGVNLEQNPNVVSDDLDIAVRTACEYWKNRGINAFADKDDFDTVTQKINGGHNGRDERYASLQRIKKKLGIV